jgi:hypothetical protein
MGLAVTDQDDAHRAHIALTSFGFCDGASLGNVSL